MSRTAAFADAFSAEHTSPTGYANSARPTAPQLGRAGKLAALGGLASGLAHELNNPLSGILGLLEFLLRDAEQGSRSEERLLLVQDTALEIKQIVGCLLGFARESIDERRPVAVRDVCAGATQLARLTSSARDVEIVERYADATGRVWGNLNQLKQIVLHLLTNAQQAMPAGGTATVEVGVDGGTVRARVTDTGPGIDADALPFIFEPFFTTRQNLGAPGLGLFVSREIARAHRGELTAVNLRGGGARFELRLPTFEPEDES
jgi:two-component system NtrC family sensor kinase